MGVNVKLSDMLSPSDVHTRVALDAPTKTAALAAVSELCTVSGASAEALEAAFNRREEEDSTGCGYGIAIPHAKMDGPITPKVVVAQFDEPVEWEAIDDLPVKTAICLVMPLNDKDNTHLAIISKFARKLAVKGFVDGLSSEHDPRNLYQYIIQNVEE